MTEKNNLRSTEKIDITIEEELLFRDLLNFLFSQYQRVVLYGLSGLTAKLLYCTNQHQKAKILFIVSDNPTIHAYQNIPVKPRTKTPDGVDLIIVCAAENESACTQKARAWGGTTPAVFSAIYDSIMLLAHRTTKNIPTGDWPRRMYYLCSSQRTGSTMLADLLKRTRVLGTPEEHFRLFLGAQVEKRIITYDEIIPQIFKNYQTQNGVFGVKIHGYQYTAFESAVTALRQDTRKHIHQLTKTAPYIFLFRKNIYRQAISLWRAQHSKSFHIYKQSLLRGWLKRETPFEVGNFVKYLIQRLSPAAQHRPDYNYSIIKKSLLQVTKERESWILFFRQREILPLIIEYETFSSNPEKTLQEIGQHIGIVIPKVKLLLKPRTHKMSDKYTEEIHAAFTKELALRDQPLAGLVDTIVEQGIDSI